MSREHSMFQRLQWLRRRVQRMQPGELRHRLSETSRMLGQSLGLGDASRVPSQAVDARYGQPWCRVPSVAELGDEAVAELVRAADALLLDGPTLWGHEMGKHWQWNADPRTGHELPMRFGLFVDFRHLPAGVDVKFLWELNRHVWWLPLAQAWALTKQPKYLRRLGLLLDSWLIQCPYPKGPNWSSPVEHGLRLVVWSLVWHWVGGRSSPLFEGQEGLGLLQRWTDSVYQHIRFASDNYSKFTSANNHLIGEAVGVYVAAQTWDLWPETRALRAQAKAILQHELLLQFRADGLNAEQAICYHKFSLHFMLAAALCGRAQGDDLTPDCWQRLGDALAALAGLMDSTGSVCMYGDADDGEVFRLDHGPTFSHYAALVHLGAAMTGRTDMAAKSASVRHLAGTQTAWLLPPDLAPWVVSQTHLTLPTRFDDSGVLVLGDALHQAHEFRLQMDVGPLGSNRIAGHGHADALSVQLNVCGEALLVDPGTYCYNTEAPWRHFFRSTRGHNTLEVDGTDQSVYGGSFLWLQDVECVLEHLHDNGDVVEVKAHHTGYQRLADPVVHHRRVRLHRPQRLLEVEDWIECARAHQVALHWHLAAHLKLHHDETSGQWLARGHSSVLGIEFAGEGLVASQYCGATDPPQGWVSHGFYQREPAPVLSFSGLLQPGRHVCTRLLCTSLPASPGKAAVASAQGVAQIASAHYG